MADRSKPAKQDESDRATRVVGTPPLDSSQSTFKDNQSTEIDGTIGPYRLEQVLGRGGQGTVYRAKDLRIGRVVALKVMSAAPGSLHHDAFLRFRREAELAAKVEHPNVCTIYDVGSEGDRHYIAMRLVEGESLARRLKSRREGAEPTTEHAESEFLGLSEPRPERTGVQLESAATEAAARAAVATRRLAERRPRDGEAVRETVRIFVQTAEAVQALHDHGILHRDIKPANIMVTVDGTAVLMDFGMAQDTSHELPTLTATGDLFGTPHYMSPEQLTRHTIKLDARSDVWSLGVSLYEALTLARPFDGPTMQAIFDAIHDVEPEDPRRLAPAISKDLKTVLETALAKERAKRYRSARAFADDLAAVLDGSPISARPLGPLGKLVRWCRRRPWQAALVATLLITLPTIAAMTAGRVATEEERRRARAILLDDEKDELLAGAYGLLAESNADAALPAFERIVRMEGSSAEAAAGIVLVHQRCRRWQDSLDALERFRSLLGDRAAVRILTERARLGLAGKRATPVAESFDGQTLDTLDHYVVGTSLLASCGEADQATLLAAKRHAATAVLMSPKRRLSLETLLAHAAGHAKDVEVVHATADALEACWPKSSVALFWSGRSRILLADDAEIERGMATLRRAVVVNPVDAQVHYSLGNTLGELGRVDEAISELQLAVDLSRETPLARGHYSLSEMYMKRGNYAEAVASARTATSIAGDFAAAWSRLAVGLANLGRLDEAEVAARRGVEIAPESDVTHASLSFVHVRRGRYAEALEEQQKAAAQPPETADEHSVLATILKKMGRTAEAIAPAERALQLEPRRNDLAKSLGLLYLEVGRNDDAERVYRGMIEKTPTDGQAHLNLGVALQRSKRYEEAEAAYNDAIANPPTAVDCHLNLGSLFTWQGRHDEALKHFLVALAIEPDRASTFVKLSWALNANHRLDHAVLAARRAVACDPNDAVALATLGAALSNAADFDGAIRALEGSLSMNPKQPEAWLHLSLTRRSNGDLRGAEQAAAEARARGLIDAALDDQERAIQELLQADERMAQSIRDGKAAPSGDSEIMAFGWHALRNGRPLQAVTWLRRLFDGTSQAGTVDHLLAAWGAIAALQVSEGSGDAATLAADQRLAWRRDAGKFLQASLNVWRTMAGAMTSEELRKDERVASWKKGLNRWRTAGALAPIRDEVLVAALPEDERQACRRFWEEVRTFQAQLDAATPLEGRLREVLLGGADSTQSRPASQPSKAK